MFLEKLPVVFAENRLVHDVYLVHRSSPVPIVITWSLPQESAW